MAKVFGLDLGSGTQQKAAVVAAVAGVLLVLFAVLNRRGGGALETGTTADVMRAVELGVTSGAGAATAGLGVGADVANTGADIARSGLSLVDRAIGVLGDTTRSLAGEVASVSARQTDLIGLFAREPAPVVAAAPSPFSAPVVYAAPAAPSPEPTRITRSEVVENVTVAGPDPGADYQYVAARPAPGGGWIGIYRDPRTGAVQERPISVSGL